MFKKIAGYYNMVKGIFKLKGVVGKMSINEIKTSEGRMTLILNVIAIYGAVQGFLPAALVAKIAVISVAAYAIARSVVKAAEAIAKITSTPKDDAIVAEVVNILDSVVPKAEKPE